MGGISNPPDHGVKIGKRCFSSHFKFVEMMIPLFDSKLSEPLLLELSNLVHKEANAPSEISFSIRIA